MEEASASAGELHRCALDGHRDLIGMHARTVERVSRPCALLVRLYTRSRLAVAPAVAPVGPT